MTVRDWPWLELACLLPALGAILLSCARRAERARRASLVLCAATLAASLAAWWMWEFHPEHAPRWSLAAGRAAGPRP